MAHIGEEKIQKKAGVFSDQREPKMFHYKVKKSCNVKHIVVHLSSECVSSQEEIDGIIIIIIFFFSFLRFCFPLFDSNL